MQLTIAPYDNTRAKDVWSTVGGAIKPSFELIVTTAGDASPFVDLPPERSSGFAALVAPDAGRATQPGGAERVRVTAGSTLVDLAPGSSTAVDLDVINTGPVIDGITARVIGLPAQQVSTTPPVLALFPEATGRLTVNLGLPAAFPAGRHPVTVEVHSRQDGTGPEYLDLDLMVPTRAEHLLAVRPKVVRAHRTARFVVTVTNSGNVRLEIALAATDPEKVITPAGDAGAGAARGRSLLRRAGRDPWSPNDPRFGDRPDRPVTVTAVHGRRWTATRRHTVDPQSTARLRGRRPDAAGRILPAGRTSPDRRRRPWC